jgi:hypothetical protein
MILLTPMIGSRNLFTRRAELSATNLFFGMINLIIIIFLSIGLFNLSFTSYHMILTLSFDNLEIPLFQMDRLFPPRPTRQLVRLTMARGATGFPAILVELLTRLGYRWYPEYTVYEVYREFNQQQYYAEVRIFDQRDNSITELHTFHGVGVTVDMAVHDAAFAAVARLRGEHNSRLEETAFRYIPYAPAGDETGYYTAVCAPYVSRRYDPQIMVQHIQALDRTARALAVELYATRTRLYDALTQLLPAVSARMHPEYILYPRRTEMPPGLEWPAVGGFTPPRGPLLSVRDQVLHQSVHGVQDPSFEGTLLRHLQLPGYSGFPRR